MFKRAAALALGILIATSIASIANADDRALRRQMEEMRTETRVALVIGNADYSASPLKNPVNDARLMARTLKALGFDVIELTNANQKQMKMAVDQFGQKIRNGGVALFYYAGHGMQVGGRNYLIPVGADITAENMVEYESVDAGRILAKMENAGTRVNIVMLDACRNNPFARSFRSSSTGLASVDAPRGSFIAYATAPGSVAADGDGSNGVFTEELVRAIQSEGLEIDMAFRQVREGVMQRTSEKQIPWTSSSMIGQFFFKVPIDEEHVAITRPPAISTPQQGSINADEFQMVLVKGGCFQMGSNDGDSDERPVHEVCLSDYYIGQYEVTVGQFREFVSSTGFGTEAERGDDCYYWTGSKWEQNRSRSWQTPGFEQADNNPVACVSWNDAQEYIKWLNTKTGQRFRLPTEAEWEYAAQSGGRNEKWAGTSSEASLGQYAWYSANSDGKTHPVGRKQANGLGLYDMSGNVWEWVQDWYGGYSGGKQRSPTGPTSGSYRVGRSGSWNDDARYARAALRNFDSPDFRGNHLGFRLAR